MSGARAGQGERPLTIPLCRGRSRAHAKTLRSVEAQPAEDGSRTVNRSALQADTDVRSIR